MSESYDGIDSVLRRLNHEIRRTVGSDTKTVTVNLCDLIEAMRAIDILRSEIKEMNDFEGTESRLMDDQKR